jgi:hypothetical protein
MSAEKPAAYNLNNNTSTTTMTRTGDKPKADRMYHNNHYQNNNANNHNIASNERPA